MSFSFRSMFQGTADPSQQGDATTMVTHGGQNFTPEAPAMMSVLSPQLNAASPFGAPMFKIALGESPLPTSSSPFSVMNSQDTSAPLTVGDVLPQLPPEVARMGALPPEQPVAISSQVLDEALRTGRAAVPLFEIYRVCPALFQTPVSPQDPRLVPLPASKLPRLIAASQANGVAEQAVAISPASPFSAAAPGADGGKMMSFSPMMGSPENMQLPPRRQGPPPPLADVPNRDAVTSSLSLPPNGFAGAGMPAFPVSPFAAVGAEMSGNAGVEATHHASSQQFRQQVASPFGVPQENFATMQQPAQGSGALSQASSPFGVMPASNASAPPSQATPFASGGLQPTAPALGAGGVSPFGALFGDKAVPTGQPAPDALSTPQRLMPQSGSLPQAVPTLAGSTAGLSSGSPVRMSLASLIKGYTAAELGFDPMVVPAWITTVLPAQMVREWSEMPTPLAQLGLVLDGITDVGFRNVLNTARRDFQIRIESTLLLDAVAGQAAPPTLPNLNNLGGSTSSGFSGFPVTTPNGASPPPGVMRVEPPPGFTPSVGPAQQQSSPYAATPPPSTPLAQGSGSPYASTSPAASSGPLPASPFEAGASSFQSFAPGANPGTPRAQDPFAAPVSPAFPMGGNTGSPPHSGPMLASGFAVPPASRASGTTTAPNSPPPPERPPESRPLSAYTAPSFSTPDATGTTQEGFSSDQLLGRPDVPEMSWSTAAAAAAMEPYEGEFAAERPRAPQVIDLPPSSSQFFNEPVERVDTPPPLPARPFIPPRLEDDEPPTRPAPPTRSLNPESPAQRTSAPARSAASSSLGVQTHDADPDQIVLRALLDTDSDLSAQRVVELTCGLPGIAACVCLHDGRSISHIGAHKPQAREFQKQASSLAQHLRTLAPLIGIDGAETFTMNSGDRLMTFCFPEGAILGVLHDAEPTLGLRDKITLIARELSRMIS